jgi:hypothetical protein
MHVVTWNVSSSKPATGKAEPMAKLYSEQDALSAMAIWECMLTWQQNRMFAADHRDMASVWNSEGACGMRDIAIGMAKHVNDAWEIANRKGFDAPFDWEFVPVALKAYDWHNRRWYGIADRPGKLADYVLEHIRSR